MTQAYVLLDRDGVINIDSDDYIKSAEEWQPIEGSLEAVALFTQHDYKVIVITNQSGLGRGLYNETALSDIHQKMRLLSAEKGGIIDAIYYCPHLPVDNCQCRKPKTELFQRFAKDYNCELSDLFYVGDKLADLQAAKAAGAKSILVKTGKGQATLLNHPEISSPIFKNLYDAAKFITS